FLKRVSRKTSRRVSMPLGSSAATTTEVENATEGGGCGEAASTRFAAEPLMSTSKANAIRTLKSIPLPWLGAKRGLGTARHADHRAGRWHIGEGDIKKRGAVI